MSSKKQEFVMSVEGIEYGLAVILVCIQLYVFCRTYFRIKFYRSIIPDSGFLVVKKVFVPMSDLLKKRPKDILDSLLDYENRYLIMTSEESFNESILESQQLGEITVLECRGSSNTVFQTIVFSINNYLIRNRNSASDFSLIKDIVERNVDAVEEEINLTISIPLYLGLMGTMLGIVIGLFNVSGILSASSTLADENFQMAITILLGGVKIAMIASFSGLLLTIVNSGWIFKGGRGQIDSMKNGLYTFLQIELLPVMNQGLGQTFESLQRNLSLFNGDFTKNLNRLSSIFDKNYEALSMQKDLLELLDRSKVSEITRYNVKVLQELNLATQQFDRFNEYFEKFNGYISNSFLITDRLAAILDRTDKIDIIANSIETNLDESKHLLLFLSQHFQLLEKQKQYVSNHVAEVAHGISGVFKDLKDHIERSSQTIKDFTVVEFELLKNALAESKAGLGNLQYLESLNTEVVQIKRNSSVYVEKLTDHVGELNDSVLKTVGLLEGIEKAQMTIGDNPGKSRSRFWNFFFRNK